MAVRCNVIEVITNKLFGEKCCDKTPHLLKSQTRSSKLKRWADTRTHTHPDPEGRSRFKKSVAKWFFRNSSLHTHSLTHVPYLKVSAGLTQQSSIAKGRKSTMITGHFGGDAHLLEPSSHQGISMKSWYGHLSSDFLVKIYCLVSWQGTSSWWVLCH